MSAAPCHCGEPSRSQCGWRRNVIVAAGDAEEATLTDDEGNRYRRVFTGDLCGLHLCERHANVVGDRDLCLWHFLRGKEQLVVPADAPASPAWRERLAREALQLLLLGAA
jgi:hypothetical protein